jgi:transposase
MRELALRLLGLVRKRNPVGFDRWLPQARSCAASDVQDFNAEFEADLPAVRATFGSPWSRGQVEGQINRLEYLQRQMHGRTKFGLLRIRVMPVSCIGIGQRHID